MPTRKARLLSVTAVLAMALAVPGCGKPDAPAPPEAPPAPAVEPTAQSGVETSEAEPRPEIYATVQLTGDLSTLSDDQRTMIGLLIEAAKIMDRLFWLQAYGEPGPFLSGINDDRAQRFADINYGPWDRLDGDRSFMTGIGDKPLGAQFYPEDMTKAEFDAWEHEGKAGLYTLVRRNTAGELTLVPFSEAYSDDLKRAAGLLESAALLAQDPGFARYLKLRAQALTSDDYQPSDLAWLDMKDNRIDLVIGAIETYEDQLYGYRAAYEAYVLLKDLAWSERLSRYAEFLPQLQRELPVPDEYKQETPGTDSDLNAYDVIYYAGHSNAGSKTIAINLPNDEEVQLAKGTRRLQLKNAMRAKFDRILVPIAGELIAGDQRNHITFDAFFGNTMFHEVAHGLGIKNTINDSGTVRQSLKELASPQEEGKADVLGLYMITRLFDQGEIPEGELMDNYVTFMAGIFRSVRFGASSAHGKANMVRFNFFRELGAFHRDTETGHYSVDYAKMREAIDALSSRILTLQGDGDYDGTKAMMDELGQIGPQLQKDLDQLSAAGIPVDVVFEQGAEVLGL